MHHEEMEKLRLTFKHLQIELLEKEKAENGGYEVTVADVASLMESLQSCLLKYWEFDPMAEFEKHEKKPAERKVEADNPENESPPFQDEPKPFRKRPIVFLLDEAHKLPALVDDPLSLKVFLDTLLVLTKQDRLCHVILSTSDSFFHHFLRSMNVGHHSQILTIGDCSKEETLAYFLEQMLPSVPKYMASQLEFEELYDAFGGKLSHISDYVSAWVNSDGQMTPYTSPIFIQAYTLLQFHLTHSKFETFSSLSTATAGTDFSDDSARFKPEDLLRVMEKMVKSPFSAPYFALCREIGTEQIDSMIKTRILELRWTRTVTLEDDGVEKIWSKDGVERPIVLPMTRIIRRAMEVILKEEGEMIGSDEIQDLPERASEDEGIQ